jgi:hypothetical protein
MITEYPHSFALRISPDIDSKIEALRGVRRNGARRKGVRANLRLRTNPEFEKRVDALRAVRPGIPPRGTLIKALIEEAWAREGAKLKTLNGEGVLGRSDLIRHLVEAEYARVFAKKGKRK